MGQVVQIQETKYRRQLIAATIQFDVSSIFVNKRSCKRTSSTSAGPHLKIASVRQMLQDLIINVGPFMQLPAQPSNGGL